MTPTTLEEAMEALKDLLSPEDQIEFVRMKKDELIRFHHGLGRWIRNNWGLWQKKELFDHMKTLGFKHPDDMSQAIIHEFWNRMNNLPSTLKEEAEEYAKFWKDKGIDEPC